MAGRAPGPRYHTLTRVNPCKLGPVAKIHLICTPAQRNPRPGAYLLCLIESSAIHANRASQAPMKTHVGQVIAASAFVMPST